MGNASTSQDGPASRPAKLTGKEKDLLSTTWHRHVHQHDTIGAKVFDQMFTSEPETRSGFALFAQIDVNDDHYNDVLHRHGNRVKAAVGRVIDDINDKDSMKSYLTTLGCRHYKEYQFEPQYINVVFRYFLQAIAELMEDDWTTQVAEAYTKLFQLISYCMLNSMCSKKTAGLKGAQHNKSAPPEELT